MPVYEYLCTNEDCKTREEFVLSVVERYDTLICKKCMFPMKRVYSAPTVIYKGQGFTGAQNEN